MGRDSRIRLIEERANLGPALSSDRVARAATAAIVARQDADDISYPERLTQQLEILQSDPEVGVVGGLYDVIDKTGRRIRNAEPWRLLRRSVFPPFGNGPMTYRNAIFESVGGYRQECEFWEDQDLLVRMAAVTKIMVIPRAIYAVRQSTTSTRFASNPTRVERAIDLMYRSRARLEENRGYDDLLKERRDGKAALDPRVYISLGSVGLWAGQRPRLLRRLIRQGKLSLDFRSLSALIWTAWASASPASLRAFIRSLLVGRNLFAAAVVETDEPVLWSPFPKAAETVEPEPQRLQR